MSQRATAESVTLNVTGRVERWGSRLEISHSTANFSGATLADGVRNLEILVIGPNSRLTMNGDLTVQTLRFRSGTLDGSGKTTVTRDLTIGDSVAATAMFDGRDLNVANNVSVTWLGRLILTNGASFENRTTLEISDLAERIESG